MLNDVSFRKNGGVDGIREAWERSSLRTQRSARRECAGHIKTPSTCWRTGKMNIVVVRLIVRGALHIVKCIEGREVCVHTERKQKRKARRLLHFIHRCLSPFSGVNCIIGDSQNPPYFGIGIFCVHFRESFWE